MTTPSPLLGHTIASRFRLLTLLGAGGAGDVFEAEPIDLPGRRVALKLCRPFGLDPREDERRFLREVKNTIRLAHPHVVELYEAGALPDGRLWYTMEMCRGRPLSKVARERPAPEVARVVRLCCQVLEALAAAHALSMVHRDVKPENILVVAGGDAREHAKLLDFGLAKITSGGARSQAITQAGMTSGTLPYMPKEQLMGTPLDGRADVHALGATLFEALAGRPPIVGAQGDDLYRAILKEVPPPLDVLCAGRVSRALSAVVARALEKDREKRWPTAEAMREALLAAVPEAALRDACPFALDESGRAPIVSAETIPRAQAPEHARSHERAQAPEQARPYEQARPHEQAQSHERAQAHVSPSDNVPRGTGVAAAPDLAATLPRLAARPAPAPALAVATALVPAPAGPIGVPATLSFDGSLALGGRYALRTLVHTGAHGPLYHAIDATGGASVAVKALVENGALEEDDWVRYGRGMHALASLRHPHVLALLDWGRSPGGWAYVVLEWLPGAAPLAAFLARRGRIPVPEACGVACQVLDALSAAHAGGVLHRDLSPRNVLVAPTEAGAFVKLTGFGQAKCVYAQGGAQTRWGKPVGTAGYMAPEQARGLPPDARADLFGLACLLQHMVAGRAPFAGDTFYEYAEAVVRAAPAPLPPDLPQDERAALGSVLARAFAKRPADRFPDAASLRSALLPLAGPHAVARFAV